MNAVHMPYSNKLALKSSREGNFTRLLFRKIRLPFKYKEDIRTVGNPCVGPR